MIAEYKYNPIEDNFLVYTPTEQPTVPKIQLSYNDTPFDLDWAEKVTDNGKPIAKQNTIPQMIRDNTEQYVPVETTPTTNNNTNLEGISKGTLDGNAEYAYKYLISKGIPKGSAAGIVGNLYHENLGNPTQTVKDSRNTTAYGIAGFNSKGALPDLLNWAGKHGIQGNPNFEQQLDYLVDQITNNSKLNILKTELSPSTASFIFGKEFERFAGKGGRGYLNQQDPEHIKRAKTADNIFKKYKV